MWLMMQADEPGDFVIGTGQDNSVRDLVETAFGYLDLDPAEHVSTDPALKRPAEVECLVADSSKAERELEWRPRTSFEELVQLMVDADLELLDKGSVAPQAVTYPVAAPGRPAPGESARGAAARARAYGLNAMNKVPPCESPRRDLEFVTRKITHAAAGIKLGMDKELVSATWTPAAIGAMCRTTCARCG